MRKPLFVVALDFTGAVRLAAWARMNPKPIRPLARCRSMTTN